MAKLKALPQVYRNLSLIQFPFWAGVAISSYLTVFLQQQGFKPNQVGFINAVISVVAILATPFWGMVADMIRSIRKIFLFCMSLGIILWALIPVSFHLKIAPTVLVYIVVILGAMFRNPAVSLFDAFLVQRANLDQVPYGHVRLWGSFSFAVMSFMLSIILITLSVEITFYLYGIVIIPLLVIMGRMKGADSGRLTKRESFRSMGFGRLFRNYYFITFLFFSMAVYIPVNSIMVFLPYLIGAVGGNAAMYGIINGCRATVEIPVLFLMRSLRRKFPLPVIISGAAAVFCIEAFCLSRVGSFYQIVLLQSFHGIGGGVLIGSATNYVYSLAPEGLNSTAHTMYGAVNSIASIAGYILGGILISQMGIFSYYDVVGKVLIVALVYFCISLIVGVKVFNKPIPFLRNL